IPGSSIINPAPPKRRAGTAGSPRTLGQDAVEDRLNKPKWSRLGARTRIIFCKLYKPRAAAPAPAKCSRCPKSKRRKRFRFPRRERQGKHSSGTGFATVHGTAGGQ